MQKVNSGVSEKEMEQRKIRADKRREDLKETSATNKGFIQTNRNKPGEGKRYRLKPSLRVDWAAVVARRRADKRARSK